MKKKKPLPPSVGEMLPVGTKVKLLRPNSWPGLIGIVEKPFEKGILIGVHAVRVSYPKKPETFLVAARFEEMKILETKELSK